MLNSSGRLEKGKKVSHILKISQKKNNEKKKCRNRNSTQNTNCVVMDTTIIHQHMKCRR